MNMDMQHTDSSGKTAEPPRRLFVLGLIALACGLIWLVSQLGPSAPGEAADTAPSGPTDTAALAAGGGAPASQGQAPAEDPFIEKLGIKVTSVHLSLGGSRVDLRYQVIDPNRAVALTNGLYGAYLLDPKGRPLRLPDLPVGGPVRQESGQMLKAGYVYSHFFPNPSGAVKSGDQVSLIIGNIRSDTLTVQ